MSASGVKQGNELTQDQLDFRQAMAHLPASVNIITTRGEAGECGITASAVCSVTDTPPTVLVCINRNSQMHDVFKQNGNLCINVLSAEQEELAKHFSGMTKVPMEERFTWDIWEEKTQLSQPALRDALVRLEGKITEFKEVGTHSVIFVELKDIRTDKEKQGLVYFSRAFQAVKGAA